MENRHWPELMEWRTRTEHSIALGGFEKIEHRELARCIDITRGNTLIENF